MSWSKYADFLAFAVVLVLIPGPDFAVLSLAYLLVLTAGLHGVRRLLLRRQVRRALDVATGTVLLGFSARLAAEHV